MMFDRSLFGDISIAFLLAAPTIALARPEPADMHVRSHAAPIVEKAADVERLSVEKRADISDE
jgi:hypothetical protein